MELEITEFVKEANPLEYQQSIHESGCNNIGQLTWNAAKESSWKFCNQENKQEFVDYFNEYGAWDNLEEWPIEELNGLFIQEISAQIREWECYENWNEIIEAQEDGQISSGIFKTENNEYYFYLGH